MSSTNKTEMGFNQWLTTDKPTMEDFNADNILVDRMLKERSAATLTSVGEAKLNVSWNGIVTRIGAEELDVGTGFYIGKDYTVYRKKDSSFVISLDADKPGLWKIGGFHYGVCRRVDERLRPVNEAGAVRGSGWESNVYHGILPRSVWYQTHRPACDPRGMVYLGNNVWVDIYLASDDGKGGLISAYDATPLTGTEGLNWYDFVERALAVDKRLLTYEEFCQMAFGSPGGLDDSNENAWTAKTNTNRQKTGYVANAVSSIGCRDAVGNVWEWLNEFTTRAEHTTIGGSGTFGANEGARARKAYIDGNGHYVATPAANSAALGRWGYDIFSPFGDGYGNIYGYYDYSLITLLGGGCWPNGITAGARAVDLNSCPWVVGKNIGARCACNGL